MNILLFHPFNFIDVHAVPVSIVAKALEDDGHNILYVSCRGTYNEFCISMAAAGLSPEDGQSEKEKVCKVCQSRTQEIKEVFNFNSVFLDQYLATEDLAVIDKLCNNILENEWFNFNYHNVPVGRYASYEFLLTEKLNKVSNWSPQQFKRYKIYLKNSLKTILAGEKLFLDFKPDRLITYNSLYSVNNTLCGIADNLSVPHYTVHAGYHLEDRVSQVTIFRGRTAVSEFNRGDSYERYSKQPLSKKKIDTVVRHIRFLLDCKSPWTYSVPSRQLTKKDLQNIFPFKGGQKLILVTMSSADEKFAASIVDGMPEYPEPLFKNELAWIESLINWASSHPEIFMIIRVHPREFPNKRESVLSEQAKGLKSIFSTLPDNVGVNWPDQNIPLHDLSKFIDVGLNSTSTAGIELLLEGIPVIVYGGTKLGSYPMKLNLVGNNIHDYFEMIEDAIPTGRSFSRVIDVFRWLSYLYEINAIDISAVYPYKSRKSLINRVFGKLVRVLGYKNLLPYMKRGLPISFENKEWLIYAITKDVESHVNKRLEEEAFSNSLSIDDEYKVIYKYHRSLFPGRNFAGR